MISERKTDGALAEPVYQVEVHGGWSDVSEEDFETANYKGEKTRTLYTRPVPAINLAEPVPDGCKHEWVHHIPCFKEEYEECNKCGLRRKYSAQN